MGMVGMRRAPTPARRGAAAAGGSRGPARRRGRAAADAADAGPRASCAMEWWFVQGWYEGARADRRAFMACLFRHADPRGTARAAASHSLLLSVLDPSTGRHEYLSQIEPGVERLVAELLTREGPTGLDRAAIDAFLEELEEYGPPAPIRLADAGPRVRARPFEVRWGGFVFSDGRAGLRLAFAEPGTGRPVSLRLAPLRPRFRVGRIDVADGNGMDYVACTRLALTGRAGGEAVGGEAWFDRQWGGMGWFAAGPQGRRRLGWDWFGIQLSTGEELLAIVHREAGGGAAILQRAWLMREGSAPARSERFEAEPLRWWTSPATGTRYPVAWRLAIPEFGLDLAVEPLADDQELRVFGPVRAVWEGAAAAAGARRGRPVSGHARVELHGYAYRPGPRAHVEDVARRVDRQIAAYLPRVFDRASVERLAGPAAWPCDPAAQTAVLAKPLWDLLDRRGKHWRPIFGLLLIEALGTPPEPYEALVAMTTEFLHNATLVIDDIQDNAETRRGGAAIHRRYGAAVAINAGNTAYFLPYLVLRDYPNLSDAQRLEIYRILSAQYVRGHFGQGQDLYWSQTLSRRTLDARLGDSTGGKILQGYAWKTGAMAEGTAEAACVIAGADAGTRRDCASFGRDLGVAFQIVDDVCDFDPRRIERGAGGRDLAEGKLTYAILRALERLPPRRRGRLAAILCDPGARRDLARRREGVELVRSSGALDRCRREARALFDAGWARVSRRLRPSEPKTLLRALCAAILEGDDGGLA